MRYLGAGSHCPWKAVLATQPPQRGISVPHALHGQPRLLAPELAPGSLRRPAPRRTLPSGAASGLPATKQGAGFANVTQRALSGGVSL